MVRATTGSLMLADARPGDFAQVQCPGVRVTVIDDREGRDMPLLRAEVGSLDMIHESGPGMAR